MLFLCAGVPNKIKTDKGPNYCRRASETSCQQFDITHITGLSYNPSGQCIVEQAHGTLKQYLHEIKKKWVIISPYTTNLFKSCSFCFKFFKIWVPRNSLLSVYGILQLGILMPT